MAKHTNLDSYDRAWAGTEILTWEQFLALDREAEIAEIAAKPRMTWDELLAATGR